MLTITFIITIFFKGKKFSFRQFIFGATVRKIACCAFFLLFVLSSKGQEMWGISNSNYAGTMGIYLNPSTIVAAPYRYDFNLFALDAFVENNYMYMPAKYKVVPRAIEGDTANQKNATMESYNPSTIHGFVHAFIVGPSVVINSGRSAWGVHVDFRAEGEALHLPNFFSPEEQDKLKNSIYFGDPITTPHVTSAAMSWAEYGVTYGRVGIRQEKDFLKWAVTLNLLQGFEGMYADIRKLNYSITDTNVATIHLMDATIAHALPSGNGSAGDIFSSRGWGLGTTIGVTYIHQMKQRGYDCNKASDTQKKYKYRLGASIIDIGRVQFTRDAQSAIAQTSSDQVWSNLDKTKFGSFNSFDTTLVSHVGGSISNKPFNIWLPMALSVQFDYCLTPQVYANASVVQRIHFAGNELARGNQDVLSLRYERRRFETAFNFSLYEYSQPAMGASLRYMFFFIGTDRLGDLAGFQDLKSADVYFGIKFSLCDLPGKKKHSTSCPAYKSNLGGTGSM